LRLILYIFGVVFWEIHVVGKYKKKLIFGILGQSSRKNKKFDDQDRARFCRETTYAAEFKNKQANQGYEHGNAIDDQVVSRYSNRVPKSDKPMSADRTKHRTDRVNRHSVNDQRLK
jgi:hypothetical protein